MLFFRSLLAALICGCALFSPLPAKANDAGFVDWAQQLLTEMVDSGEINSETRSNVLTFLSYKTRVIELDQKQPEKKVSYADYRKRILSDSRITNGRANYKKHQKLLNEIGDKYGVQPKYIIALWGIETNYGSFTGGMQVLSSLATLAYEGRRSEFFTAEFKKAIQIAEQLDRPVDQLKGSWAGAMGQCQFMPSSYFAYAVDYDGDGKKDIWNSMPDVFASMANYLSSVGWTNDLHWGRAVTLPDSFPMDQEGRDIKKPLSYWANQGVTLLGGGALPVDDNIDASIIVPDKDGNDAFIVSKNFNTIMHWNRSTYFATSVGLLADQIAID
jgi:membrane-bound lytic murein transglycosylase B|tara:strand:+ start:83929 stop:84915 length:987 start_codon:yes stop_codon:yes gene_type:complete